MAPRLMGLAFAMAVGAGLCAPAVAETTEEQAYGFGAFAGAAVFCGVPQAEVTEFSEKLLRVVGVDTTQSGPAMTKFTEGVTAGVVEMRDSPKVDCATVKSTFADLKAKMP